MRPSADGTGTNLVMIYNTTTGLFKSTDAALHTWSLQNGDFYPSRGGGGGLFYRLPKAHRHRLSTPPSTLPRRTKPDSDVRLGTNRQPSTARTPAAARYTHMLQSDFPGHPDGTAFYALGAYDEQAGSFDGVTGPLAPRALDFSPTFVYNQLGYVTFRLNFHHLDYFELDLRGHTRSGRCR